MPITDSPQSAATPNLPGSEVAESKPSNSTTPAPRTNARSSLVEGILELAKPKEQRSGTPSTPGASTPAQERADSPAEPQPEVAADTTEEASPNGQPNQPQLTTEEQTRREEQSFKDKFYALERERDKEKVEREALLERQRFEQMGHQEQEAYQRFQAQVGPLANQAAQLKAAADDLDEKARDALSEGDRPLAEYFARQRDVMRNAQRAADDNVQWQYNGFNQALQQYRQQVHTERMTAQEKQIQRSLTKAGLTLDDLKAVAPKLNMADNFAVIEAVAEAKEAKYKADIKAAKEDAARIEKEAKAKWRTDSPAARPDRPVSGAGSSNANQKGPGSGRQSIIDGLRSAVPPRR